MADVRNQVMDIIRQVLDDPKLVLRDEMTAEDVDGWDSLANINLIIAVERGFAIKFATAEIEKMKEPGQTVGDFMQLVDAKVPSRSSNSDHAGPAEAVRTHPSP